MGLAVLIPCHGGAPAHIAPASDLLWGLSVLLSKDEKPGVLGIEVFDNDERPTCFSASVQKVMDTALGAPTTTTPLKEVNSAGNG